MKPRVLFVHQWKSAGGLYGSDKVLLDFLQHATTIKAIVVVESEGRFADLARAIPCEVIIRNMGVLRQKHMTPFGLLSGASEAVRSAFWIARYVRRNNVAGVVSNTASVLAGAMGAKLSRRPHLWLIHEILEGKARLLAPLVKCLSDRVIAVSRASAESLGAMNKTDIAYPGVNISEMEGAAAAPLRAKYGIPARNFLIGMVGRIHYWKGQDYFLNALAELKRLGVSDFHALVVGDVYAGYEHLKQHLITKTRHLGLANQVVFCGHIDDMAGVYAALDLVVAPSTRPDPFCLVVAEGLAAGRPVISTDWGGPREIIQDGVNGILIPPNDPLKFARALEKLFRDRDLRHRLGSAGRKRVQECFSRDTFNRKVLHIIESLFITQKPDTIPTCGYEKALF